MAWSLCRVGRWWCCGAVPASVNKEGEADDEVIEVVWAAEALMDGDVTRSKKGLVVVVLEVEWTTSVLARSRRRR